SEGKTTAYKIMGADGMMLAFIKAILCNWMVTLGAVMAMTSKSTTGKIFAMWLPILTFFGQGFEHTVVNFFVIPAGMMLGADISFADWWIWNGIPVLLGNFAGGLLFTGILLHGCVGEKPMKQGSISIVGAGPGDPELITVKVLRRIQNADVILYDRLVNEELLGYAKSDALLIYCGKAPGLHSMPQESTERLMIKHAAAGCHVVRLKGGDPFVFGRGGEEALAAAAAGIPYEVIPGITSAIGAAASAGLAGALGCACP
ncbi:hypothetical protein KC345_g11944, partial [Hortaea werneckii]